MKKKFGISLGSAILLAAICVGMVFAFSYTTTDGYWGQIDAIPGDGYTDDADCDGWGKVTNSNYTIGDVIGVIYNTNYGPGGEDETYVRKAAVCGGDVDGDGTFTDWNRTGSAVWTGLGSHSSTCVSNAPNLYISEYVWNERIINPDQVGIEIFNKTGAPVSTTGWSLLIFTADNAFTQISLTSGQTIANNDVWVMVNDAAAGQTNAEDQTFGNNDDYRTVILMKDYALPVVDGTDFDWPDSVQDDVTTDENQVRYGRPEGDVNCPNGGSRFAAQSGFGFEGIEDRAFEPIENQPFPIGRFCHYNNPIYSAVNKLETVPLYMNVNDVTCPAGWTLDEPGNDLQFQYQVNLDETTNTTDPCTYGTSSPQWPGGSSSPKVSGDTGPNRNGCADMVNFSNVAGAQSFTCRYDATHAQDYTVSILGFTPTQAGGSCPDVPVGTVTFNRIYTAETVKNCFCVYAAFTEGQITPVVLKYLSAEAAENGILVSWETATEVNNLGFNVFRAELVDGERVRLNPELILSEVGPGGMTGATYEFLDETAAVGVTYYYWLEDVPLESGVTPFIYGPISAAR
ncbi:MAG TPA: choice-of-anchor K domain-containing protein [Anaerolineaceae bacterium]|nr:choice-of-anchor K domain-containing protein [Anaerolineaceae bacterium]